MRRFGGLSVEDKGWAVARQAAQAIANDLAQDLAEIEHLDVPQVFIAEMRQARASIESLLKGLSPGQSAESVYGELTRLRSRVLDLRRTAHEHIEQKKSQQSPSGV